MSDTMASKSAASPVEPGGEIHHPIDIKRGKDQTESSRAEAVSCLVIGLGVPALGDAAVGLLLAQKLKDHYPKMAVTFNQANKERLVNDLNKAELIIILDALDSNQLKPGTLRTANLTQSTEPLAAFRHSSALVSVCQALELARMLGQPHAELWAVGIAGHQFTEGEHISQSVKQALWPASEQVLSLIKRQAPSVYLHIIEHANQAHTLKS